MYPPETTEEIVDRHEKGLRYVAFTVVLIGVICLCLNNTINTQHDQIIQLQGEVEKLHQPINMTYSPNIVQEYSNHLPPMRKPEIKP